MPPLASDLRKQLENVCIAARDAAEAAACSALKKRAVDQAKPFAHFNEEDKRLRRWLRARGKQAGDVEGPDKSQSIEHLTQELAYEYWHRMLFARFLAENHLLMHPDGVAVSLEECEELAPSERAPNGYVLAARYASRMLPQIFRIDDVLLDIEFAPEQRLALERLLASLPRETFLADDSLGWVYQFWQTKRKDEVNKSGDKIDGRTLPAVTQLFTEDYMVQFLLHNTIGAWWCGRQGIAGPPGGAGVPAGKSPVPLDYLRWAPGLAVAPVAQPPPAGATGEGAQPGAAGPQSKEPTGSRDGDVAQPPRLGRQEKAHSRGRLGHKARSQRGPEMEMWPSRPGWGDRRRRTAGGGWATKQGANGVQRWRCGPAALGWGDTGKARSSRVPPEPSSLAGRRQDLLRHLLHVPTLDAAGGSPSHGR